MPGSSKIILDLETVKDIRSAGESNPSLEMSVVVFAMGPLKQKDSWWKRHPAPGSFLKQQQKVTWGKKVHANFLVKVKTYLQSMGHKALSGKKKKKNLGFMHHLTNQ